MKNSILILALVLAMPNIYAVQRQENISPAAENARNQAAAKAAQEEEIFSVPFRIKHRTTAMKKKTTSMFQRVRNKFTSTPVAEDEASEQEEPTNIPQAESTQSTSTSSTAQAPDATPVDKKQEPTVQAQAGYTARAMQTLAAYKTPIVQATCLTILALCAANTATTIGYQLYQAHNAPVVYPTYWVNSLIPSWPVQLS